LFEAFVDAPLACASIGQAHAAKLTGGTDVVMKVRVRRHQLRFPPNLALLAKTLGMCEGLAAHLDPQFRMTEAIAPHVAQLLSSSPADASVD